MAPKVWQRSKILCFLALFLFSSNSNASPWLLNGSVRGLVLPLYLRDGEESTAIIRIDEAHNGHARKLFFRIGIIPELSIRGLHLTIRDKATAAAALRAISRILQDDSKFKSVSVRGFSLQILSQPCRTIEATTLRYISDGRWAAEGLSVSKDGRTLANAPRGTIYLSGDLAGLIQLESAEGRIEMKLGMCDQEGR